MSQRLSESAVKGTLHWFSDDERSSFTLGRHGLLSVPMGVRPDGRLIYPIAGASPDDPSNDEGGAGGSGDGGAGGGSEGQGGTGDSGAGNGTDGNKDDGATIPKSEYEKLQERMKAADRNAAAALAKLKELEEKDLSEQEKVLKRVPELEQTVATLTEENKGLKAKVAFLGLDGFSWNDPDIALSQVDLSEVLKEDGETIDKAKLKKAAEALAKDKPFLSKAKQDDGGNGGGKGGQGNNSGGQGSSGAGVGSGQGGAGSTNALTEEALRKKYPALN